MLKVGDKAYPFKLNDQHGVERTLSEFLGKKVILYFYPKDNTPGCTREAEAFRDLADEIGAEGGVIIGVSKDSVASHVKFADKYALPFILLSDPELDTIKAYGAWQEKKMYGKTVMGVARCTFIIGGDGAIVKVYDKVKPDTHAAETLSCIKA